MPLALGLITNNYKGVSKKMTMSAILFVIYCAGNIGGPQTFISSEAPKYATAFRAIMICYALAALVSLGLRAYLRMVNKQRDEREGDDERAVTDKDEDVTDFHTPGFRYRL